MKLTVFNGSPRGTGSNTKILLEQFVRGFCETEGNTYDLFYLNRVNEHRELAETFRQAETVLLAFPMYTDTTPAQVKHFIECLAPLRRRPGNPPVAFIVQYGFHEGIHGKALAAYLEKLAKRLDAPLLGIATRGGIEGIQSMAPENTQKLFDLFYELGKGFGNSGRFDPDLTALIARKDRFPQTENMAEKMKQILNVTADYWDTMLKSNGAYEKRFDKPSLS